MRFYLLEEQHTLASVLRAALERLSDGEELVSCSLLHPIDTFLEVNAPSEQFLRHALLNIKSDLDTARKRVRERRA